MAFKDILASKLIFGTLLPQDKYYLVGKLVSTVIVFIWNFAGRKFIIFDKIKSKQERITHGKVIIIGAGPAGLTAAIELLKTAVTMT